MAENPNGSPTFKPVKNPGKLNTSFWEKQVVKDGGADAAKKPRKKKKKSKMASMWEQRAAEEAEKKKIDPTPKKNVTDEPVARDTNETNTNTDASANNDIQETPTTKSEKSDNADADGDGDVNTDTIPTKAKSVGRSSKVAALAGKLNINPMGLKGGLPPSLRKKREEQKGETDLSKPEFLRPVIPPSTRRKSTKKNIISITNKQINEELRNCLQENFVFDDRMLVSGHLLCCYLKDITGIDLSMIGNEAWNESLLIDAVKEVFGEKAIASYGYSLKTI